MGRMINLFILRLVQLGSLLAALTALHSLLNLKFLKRPRVSNQVNEPVSVLLPVLNEADRIGPTLISLMGQQDLSNLELIIRDDGSTDDTVRIISSFAKHAPFPVKVITAASPTPADWVSKSWSCYQMSQQAAGSVLIFIDADVEFEPTAFAQAVRTLREGDLDLISPYPKQLAISWSERLIQPLLQWSWLTFLPLKLAEKSKRPELAAANGQFLVVDANMYHHSGGHGANPSAVLDDIALLQAIKRSGGRGIVVDGTDLATTRMYKNVRELTDGYTKSLWSAVGGRRNSRILNAVLFVAFVLPPIAAIGSTRRQTRLIGLLGYLAAVLSRVATARKTKANQFPDPFAHPISILGYIGLVELSWYRRMRNKLNWRGKIIP